MQDDKQDKPEKLIVRRLKPGEKGMGKAFAQKLANQLRKDKGLPPLDPARKDKPGA